MSAQPSQPTQPAPSGQPSQHSAGDLVAPFLWFQDGAEEAIHYYVSVFPDSRIEEIQHYPDESLDEHYTGMAGKVISAWFTLGGRRFGALDGGPAFRITEAVSFAILCQDQDEIDRYWAALSHVPEAEQCGWCKDRFGVSWQIVPARMGELLTNPAQIQAMMRQKKIDIAELEALAGPAGPGVAPGTPPSTTGTPGPEAPAPADVHTIWHLALPEDLDEARTGGTYEVSTRGKRLTEEGFVHASLDLAQAQRVRAAFYADRPDAVLLELPVAALEAAGLEVRVEPWNPADPTAEQFPHIYGGPIPAEILLNATRNE